MVAHDLKIWPEYFKEVAAGSKPFEIRKNDRNFQFGDTLVLSEFDPDKKELTGEFVEAEITYLTDFAQKEDYVVLGIQVTKKPSSY